jgi:hypothetical protein
MMLILQSSVGAGMREGGSVCLQLAMAPTGTQAVYILSDQRSPTLQAVLQPGQEGKVLRLSSSLQPAPGLSLDLEASVAASGAWQSAKVASKWAGEDFLAAGSLTLPLERGAPHAELTYHQSLGEGTGCTAGGSLNALLAPPGEGGLLPALLPPAPQQVFWGTFASWTSHSRASALHVRYGQQPRQEAPPMEVASLTFWRRASKHLELGADLSVASSSPVASGAGVGMRMTLAGSGQAASQGLAPVLTAHASSEMVLGVSLQTPSASPVSNTFMRSTLTAVLDHRQRDYKLGAAVEMYC